MFPAVSRRVNCEFSFDACTVNLDIDSEDYVLVSSKCRIKKFDISGNRNVKFLPKFIGKNFGNLEEFFAKGCGLTVIRDFYFDNMFSVTILLLSDNRIASIESGAFKDLISVKELWLNNNLIETLEDRTFYKTPNLKILDLSYNKIKLLGPKRFTFRKLDAVYLKGNVCIDGNYGLHNSTQLKDDLAAKCSLATK